MGFVGNYAPCGLSPQSDDMPVIHKKRLPAEQTLFYTQKRFPTSVLTASGSKGQAFCLLNRIGFPQRFYYIFPALKKQGFFKTFLLNLITAFDHDDHIAGGGKSAAVSDRHDQHMVRRYICTI